MTGVVDTTVVGMVEVDTTEVDVTVGSGMVVGGRDTGHKQISFPDTSLFLCLVIKLFLLYMPPPQAYKKYWQFNSKSLLSPVFRFLVKRIVIILPSWLTAVS